MEGLVLYSKTLTTLFIIYKSYGNQFIFLKKDLTMVKKDKLPLPSVTSQT